MDHRRLRSGGNSCGAGTDTASRSSNAARFLALCLLCALLTVAYAWFTLARSTERAGQGGLPPITGALDAEPGQPAPNLAAERAGLPRVAERTDADAAPVRQQAAEVNPSESTPAGTEPTDADAAPVAPQAAEPNPVASAPADAEPIDADANRDAAAAGGMTASDSTGAIDSARMTTAPTDTRAAEPAAAEPAPEKRPAPAPRRRFLVRHTGLDRSHGFLAVETDALGKRTREASPLMCHRLHFAAGQGSCLVVGRDFFTTYTAVLFDSAFTPRHRIPLNGIPSRTRVSPDGRHAAITVFVTGHSYADSLFSTETSIVDTETGALVVANMEELPVLRDGQPFYSLDFNFWGVTFAADGDRFLATLGTGGVMYLVEGSLADRAIRVVAEGVECPALSPDETRIAFKLRMPGGGKPHWRPHVLDLDTLEATPLAEDRSVDDQVEWLDDEHILYGLPEEIGSPIADVWVLPADGSGRPEIFLEQASSPTVLRRGAAVTVTSATED